MKVQYYFYAGGAGEADELLLTATGEIPFVPSLGLDIRVFEDAELHEVSSVIWAAYQPESIEVWFKCEADVEPAFFIQQGWRVETYADDVTPVYAEDLVGSSEVVPRIAA